jgi:hypothetical protein
MKVSNENSMDYEESHLFPNPYFHTADPWNQLDATSEDERHPP